MACGYYCVKFECYNGMDAIPEKLMGTSWEKRYFTGVPKSDQVLYSPESGGIVVRTIISGPYPTLMIAEMECQEPEPSDSQSSSLSASASRSESQSESISESDPSPPYVCPSDCCFRIVDLNNLNFCCSEIKTFSDFGPNNNEFYRVADSLWYNEYSDGLGYAYYITMSSADGPVEYNGVIYGANGEKVFILTVQCAGELVDMAWSGVREETPIGTWTPLGGCNFEYGGITISDCESSDSSSSSFSI